MVAELSAFTSIVISAIDASLSTLYTGVFLATVILNTETSPSAPSFGVQLILYSLASALVTSANAFSYCTFHRVFPPAAFVASETVM